MDHPVVARLLPTAHHPPHHHGGHGVQRRTHVHGCSSPEPRRSPPLPSQRAVCMLPGESSNPGSGGVSVPGAGAQGPGCSPLTGSGSNFPLLPASARCLSEHGPYASTHRQLQRPLFRTCPARARQHAGAQAAGRRGAGRVGPLAGRHLPAGGGDAVLPQQRGPPAHPPRRDAARGLHGAHGGDVRQPAPAHALRGLLLPRPPLQAG